MSSRNFRLKRFETLNSLSTETNDEGGKSITVTYIKVYSGIVGVAFVKIGKSRSSRTSTIGIWAINRKNNERKSDNFQPFLLLQGHETEISVLEIQRLKSSSLQISSASDYALILWKVNLQEQTYERIFEDTELLHSAPSALVTDRTGLLIAVGVGREVAVLQVKTGSTFARLQGHRGRVTGMQFSPITEQHLITVSDDRTYKVWDLAARTCLFQSPLLSASPLVVMALHPTLPLLACCDRAGKLWVHRIDPDEGFGREMHSLDVKNALRNLIHSENAAREKQKIKGRVNGSNEDDVIISALPVWAQNNIKNAKEGNMSYEDTEEEDNPYNDVAEIECAVLSVGFVTHAAAAPMHSKDEFVGMEGPATLHNQPPGHIVIATQSHLLQVDLRSCDLRILEDFNEPPNEWNDPFTTGLVTLSGISDSLSEEGTLDVVAASAFGTRLGILRYSYTAPLDLNSKLDPDALPGNMQDLSLFPSSSLNIPSNSPLRAEMRSSSAPSSKYQGSSARRLSLGSWEKPQTKKGQIKDQPVTFHSKVKSSGYNSTPPPRKLGQRPSAGLSSRKKMSASAKRTGGGTTNPLLRDYPMDCGPLIHRQEQHRLPVGGVGSPILCQEFSGDAQSLAVGCQDGRVRIVRLPVASRKGEFSVLEGHAGSAITSVQFAHSGQSGSGGAGRLLITAGRDRCARMWLPGRADPVLEFSHTRQSPRPGEMQRSQSGGRTRPNASKKQGTPPTSAAVSSRRTENRSSVKPNLVFGYEVTGARFFYLNKFVLISCGSRIHMYKYDISSELQAKNDLIRHMSAGRYMMVHEWHTGAQSVSSFSCANSFMSPLVIAAASNKSIYILDAASGQILRQIPNSHARAPSFISLPPESAFSNCSQDSCNVFISCATDNAVNLWDIRSCSRVARFSSHANRRDNVRASLSPCMRYLASGSENKTAYFYDLRVGEVLSKLQGHTDVVSAASFNPLFPQVCTGSFDSTINFYTSEL